MRRAIEGQRIGDYPQTFNRIVHHCRGKRIGLWGCGAFANDPVRTARDFREALETEFAGAFAEVVFAIVDWSPERRFLGPFREVFAARG